MMKKNPHAVALGRLGGRKGGRARAEKLSSEELSDISRKAGRAGGKARAEKLSAAQLKKIARIGAEARWKRSKAATSRKEKEI